MQCIRTYILLSVSFAVINLRIAHFATDPRIPQ